MPSLSNHQEQSNKYAQLNGFLGKYFLYYRNLPDNLKKLFLKRVFRFIKITRIIGKDGFQVTNEVKLLLAASAVQLTFGHNQFILPMFRTFYIYKDVYFNRLTNQYHKGEVNPKGLTVISWKHFIEGYAYPTDKLNVGLHEMAHAFLLNTMYTDLHDPKLDEFLVKVIHLSRAEIEKIKQSDTHFFRPYAKENVHEFFAVAVEYFFEAPKEFRDELPELYKYLARLLNQDPANNMYRGIKYDDYLDATKDNSIRRLEYVQKEFTAKPGMAILMALPKLLALLLLINVVLYAMFVNNLSNLDHFFVQASANILALYFYLRTNLIYIVITNSHLVVKQPLKFFNTYKSIRFENIMFIDFMKYLRIAFLEKNKMFYLRSYYYLADKTYRELCKRLIDKNVIVRGQPAQNKIPDLKDTDPEY